MKPFVVSLAVLLAACAPHAGSTPHAADRATWLRQDSVEVARQTLAFAEHARALAQHIAEVRGLLLATIEGQDDIARLVLLPNERGCALRRPTTEWRFDSREPGAAPRRRGLVLLERELPGEACGGR